MITLVARTCSTCLAPIIWARTEQGRAIPLDAEPNARGNLVLDGAVARHATAADAVLERPHYTSHFANCKDAALHRKPRAPRATGAARRRRGGS